MGFGLGSLFGVYLAACLSSCYFNPDSRKSLLFWFVLIFGAIGGVIGAVDGFVKVYYPPPEFHYDDDTRGDNR